MTKRAVFYLQTGPCHLANMVVSLRSLRRVWCGDVLVYAWPESFEIAQKICAVPEISAMVFKCDATYRRKNAQECAKIPLIYSDPVLKDYDTLVYLDADTTIQKSISPLFHAAEKSEVGFAGTQFGSWKMPQGVPTTRVSRMLGIDGIDQEMVKRSLLPGMPSYNSGIFATTPDSPVLPVWADWTYKARSIYISGECALHPIAQKFPIRTLENGMWNCSPMFQSRTLADEDVGIWHFHGDCNLRPNKSEKGVGLWWPEYQKVYDENVAGIREWWDKIGNDFLIELSNAKAADCLK